MSVFVAGRHVPSDVVQSLQDGKTIEAIKNWRAFTGENLKEAKDFIEQNRFEILNGRPQSGSPESSSSKELPKQDLLLKMLRMTESDNDGQSLVAIRKANALLQSAGWTWEKLLSGKITVVADPFASIPEINREAETHRAPATPYRAASVPPRAPPPPRSTTPPPPASRPPMPFRSPGIGMKWEWNVWNSDWEKVSDHAAPPSNPQAVSGATISSRSNNYGNSCYCCGTSVDSKDGFIFQGADYGLPSKWHTVCKSCNTSVKTIPRSAAKRKVDNNTFQARVPNSAIDNL